MQGVWKSVTLVFALIAIQENTPVEGCSALITCLGDNGANWSGSTPNPTNVDVTLWTSFYTFLCSNRQAYLSCEEHNRTQVLGCSQMVGAGYIDGTYGELSQILEVTCRHIDGLVESAKCVSNPAIASNITDCNNQFRLDWAASLTGDPDSVASSYCRVIDKWTNCKATLMIFTCPEAATALNVWDQAQQDAFCPYNHASTTMVHYTGLLTTLSILIFLQSL